MLSSAVRAMSGDASVEALVAAAREGDRAAFSTLVHRYRESVYACAFAHLGDREEAEDIAQETFVRAYQSLPRLRGLGSWEAWLMRIARNLCRDALRRRRARPTAVLDEMCPDDHPSPEALALADEQRRELSAAVAALPEQQRVPVLLHYASGLTYREISTALDMPLSTVIGRMAGALRRLRRDLVGEKER